MEDQKTKLTAEAADEAPPVLGSWRALYLLVIALHFVLIGIFYWFTRAYA